MIEKSQLPSGFPDGCASLKCAVVRVDGGDLLLPPSYSNTSIVAVWLIWPMNSSPYVLKPMVGISEKILA